MAVSFDTLKAGDKLYSMSRERAGNTTARRDSVRQVVVKEVDHERRLALVAYMGREAWRGPVYFASSNIRRWPLEWISTGFGKKCSICYAEQAQGHHAFCEHPKAVAARKKAASK